MVAEIDALYQRKIAALRRLPPHERAQALRAARDARTYALKALRDKRAAKRQAERALRKLKAPAFGHS